MLRFLRRNARSWVMYIILGIIIFVFVLYFGSTKADRGARAIAVIDGRAISEAELHDEYVKLTEIVRERYKTKLTPEALKQMDLKKMAYDNLLNRQIIISKAADMKIQVSNEELKNTIMSLPALQTDGIFDERKYHQMLRYNRSSAEDFEAMQRIDMTANKIEALIREGIKISDKELFDVYAMQNQKINVNFVQVARKDVRKKIVPTQDELETYLKNNSNKFRIAEQVKIKYLSFAAGDFASGNISDAEIRDYYNRNQEKYKTKDGKQIQFAEARNAVFKEFKNIRGIQQSYQEAKKAHDIIYQEDNFDAYAAKNNLKISRLEFFPVNNPPREFAAVKDLAAILVDLQKNDISKVITADNACYLLKVVEKKTAYLPQLKEIRSEVEKSFVESAMQSQAEKEAFAILEKLKKGESLEKVARENDLKINETGLFQPGNVIPKLGTSPDSGEALIQLSAGKPYPEKPLLINNAWVIFKFKDASKIDVNDFAAKKEIYKKIYIPIKREETMKTWLEGNTEAMKKEGRIKLKKDVKEL